MTEEKKAPTSEPKVEKVEATEKTSTTKTTANASQAVNANNYAIVSLVLGVIGLCGFCFPLCCAPFSLLGIVFGYLGMQADKDNQLAKIGLVISAIAFVVGICMFFVSFVFGWIDFATTDYYSDWN